MRDIDPETCKEAHLVLKYAVRHERKLGVGAAASIGGQNRAPQLRVRSQNADSGLGAVRTAAHASGLELRLGAAGREQSRAEQCKADQSRAGEGV